MLVYVKDSYALPTEIEDGRYIGFGAYPVEISIADTLLGGAEFRFC